MLRIFRKNEDGAVLVYVAMALVVLLGVISLSFDLGRHNVLSEELQKAADAAATAGAYQLDTGDTQADVRQRVLDAALGTPITVNVNRVGINPGTITISNVYVLTSIPADDDTPIADGDTGGTLENPYRYVRVITTAETNNNIFGRILGQPATISLTAEAVARRGQAVCQITPLFVCNPAEAINGAGAPFIFEDWKGKQIIAKDGSGSGPSAQWFPGNFGYLDVLGSSGGAALAQALASVNGAAVCFSGNVETKPGGTEGARNALNTRFDLYESPMPGGFNMAMMGPAENVRKGYSGNSCGQTPGSPETEYMGLPDDKAFDSFPDYPDARVGNGIWDCAAYWGVNHAGVPPADCTSDTSGSDLTRFELYRQELADNIVGSQSLGGEVGDPVCNAVNMVPTPAEMSRDRRIITMALINCIEHADEIGGGSTELPVEAFVNGFLTKPASIETSKANIYLEIVGTDIPGDNSLAEVIARDWVEVVR